MPQLHATLDRILQESVALYDPAVQVIVFVFLLSPTGNSMAVWRRKLALPEALRAAHEQEIEEAKADLDEDYPVYVEEYVCLALCALASSTLTCGLQAASAFGAS